MKNKIIIIIIDIIKNMYMFKNQIINDNYDFNDNENKCTYQKIDITRYRRDDVKM